MEKVKYLSLLASTINMLVFNRSFVAFLLRSVFESNPVLGYVFKNVNIDFSRC